MWRVLVVVALLAATCALSGCPSDPACARNSDCPAGNYCSGGTCARDCTAETVMDDCPAGSSCSSFGMCLSPPDGGPLPDSGPRDGGTDAPPFDGGAACVAAGGTDVDGDGACADTDCDDRRADRHPTATEVCTAADATFEDGAIDEDCDGAIDEDCTFHVGEPHWWSGLAVQSWTRPHWISLDGLRLYLTASTGGPFTVWVTSRPSLDAPFDRPVQIVGGLAPYNIVSVHLSDDERTMHFAGDTIPGASTGRDIYVATRPDIESAFGAPTRVNELSTASSDNSPRILSDQLEAFVATVATAEQRLFRARRASIADPWGPLELVTLTGLPTTTGDETEWISRDGRTILFRATLEGGQRALFRGTRDDADGATFAVTELTALTVSGADLLYPVWSEATDELFFASARAWSTGTQGTWRARVCRDGPCPPREPIDCPSARRSEDGTHCYTAVTEMGTWANAYAACVAREAHLATIHSAAELAVVAGTVSRGWIGGYDGTPGIASLPPAPQCVTPCTTFAWVTGDAWTYSLWRAGEPNDYTPGEDALETNATGMNDGISSSSLPATCETEEWPTW